MLVSATHLVGTPILSLQASGPIGRVASSIVDPDTLRVIAFRVEGPGVSPAANILDASSVREYSSLGMVIDSADELVADDDIVKISNCDLFVYVGGETQQTRPCHRLHRHSRRFFHTPAHSTPPLGSEPLRPPAHHPSSRDSRNHRLQSHSQRRRQDHQSPRRARRFRAQFRQSFS